jgi:hypothetical protein
MPAITVTADMGQAFRFRARTTASSSRWSDDIVVTADLESAKGIVLGALLGLTVWAPVIGYFYN